MLRNNRLHRFYILGFLSLLLGTNPLLVSAQLTNIEQDLLERKMEDRYIRQKLHMTPDEIIYMIKERAMYKVEKQRRQAAKQYKISANAGYGYETNPLSSSLKKGDYFSEAGLSLSWLPPIAKSLGSEINYRFSKQDYFQLGILSTINNSLTGALKYYPFPNKKLQIRPEIALDWLRYPYLVTSDYQQFRPGLRFTYNINRDWSYGGKYEYSDKVYYKKATLDTLARNLNYHREDIRNSMELWLKRNIGKLSLRLRGKGYRNNSNAQYQDYYDYDSLHGYLTLSRSFLKNNKLYLSFTPDFEHKDYLQRLATGGKRYENITQWRLDVYYTLNKFVNLSYGVSFRDSSSNSSDGEFSDLTNQLGMNLDF